MKLTTTLAAIAAASGAGTAAAQKPVYPPVQVVTTSTSGCYGVIIEIDMDAITVKAPSLYYNVPNQGPGEPDALGNPPLNHCSVSMVLQQRYIPAPGNWKFRLTNGT